MARCLGILREVILKSNLQFITVKSSRTRCRPSVEILPPTPAPKYRLEGAHEVWGETRGPQGSQLASVWPVLWSKLLFLVSPSDKQECRKRIPKSLHFFRFSRRAGDSDCIFIFVAKDVMPLLAGASVRQQQESTGYAARPMLNSSFPLAGPMARLIRTKG